MADLRVVGKDRALIRIVRSDDIPQGKFQLIIPSVKGGQFYAPIYGLVVASSIPEIEGAVRENGRWRFTWVLVPQLYDGRGTSEYVALDGDVEMHTGDTAVVAANKIVAVYREGSGWEPFGGGRYVKVAPDVMGTDSWGSFAKPDLPNLPFCLWGTVLSVGPRTREQIKPGDRVGYVPLPSVRCSTTDGGRVDFLGEEQILFREIENCA